MRASILLAGVLLVGCGDPNAGNSADPTGPRPEGVAFEQLRVHPDVARALSATSRIRLEEAIPLWLFSIDPAVYRSFGYGGLVDPDALAKADRMLSTNVGVKGEAAVEDFATRRELVHGMYRDLAEPGPPAGCYEPRHAVLARADEDVLVLLICFECDYVVVLDESGAGRYSFGSPQSPLKTRLDALLADDR